MELARVDSSHFSQREWREKKNYRRLKCLLLGANMCDKCWEASHSCIDAAHKFLMLLDIHSPPPSLPCLESKDFLKVMRSLNADWGQSMGGRMTSRKFSLKFSIFKSRTLVPSCSRVCRLFAHMQKASRTLPFRRSRRVMKSTANCFLPQRRLLNCRVDDTTIVFIGRVFQTKLFFCYENRRKKNSVRSWHHMVYVCLLVHFICHRPKASMYWKWKSLANLRAAAISSLISPPLPKVSFPFH